MSDRGGEELNRDRWEERETKAYLAGDHVDADFPGVTMVIRTFRRTWKVVWKGKRDRHGRKLYVKVGKPTQEVAWHVEDKLTRRLDLNIMSAMMVARSLGMWVCAHRAIFASTACAEAGRTADARDDGKGQLKVRRKREERSRDLEEDRK